MNIRIFLGAVLLLPVCLTQGECFAQDKFQISGTLSAAGNDRMAVLSYVNQDGKNAKDTAALKDGKFTFNGTTAFANKAYLSLLPAKGDYQEFYLEKGKYKVTGKDSAATAVITGAQAQKDYVKYNTMMGDMPRQWRELNQRAMKVIAAKDSAGLKLLQQEGKVLYAKMEATLDSFIFSHKDSYVALDLVSDNKTSVIDPKVFDPYYSAFTARVMGSFTGKKMTAKYEKAKQLSLGKTLDFIQQDTLGQPFTLSSLRGKYVLVDFWASWCAPCRAENPNLLKAYNELKDRKFDIVSVSLDESRVAWLKAVEKDKLPWSQVSDLKGWKNEVAVKYGISAVPQNVLIDPNGVIIAKNLRGEALDVELGKLIK